MLFAQTFNGGTIDLHNVTTIPSGSTQFLSHGAGGLIDLTSLVSFTDDTPATGTSNLHALAGGRIDLSPGTVTVTNVDVLAHSLITAGTLDLQPGSRLFGTGTLDANLMNSGQVHPGASPGMLTIDGDYEQTASGSLNIEIAGPVAGSQFDQLVVTGAATLAGTLNVFLIGGFDPAVGTTFQVLTYGSLAGTFDTITDNSVTKSFAPTYNATDLTLTAVAALMAARVRTGTGQPPSISQSDLPDMVDAALARWAAAGVPLNQILPLRHADFIITDLPGAYLALAGSDTIWLDRDAAGHGWFFDESPSDDLEFSNEGNGELQARGDTLAAERIDLLTVIEHELAHLLGLDHAEAEDHAHSVMLPTLEPGERPVPAVHGIDWLPEQPGKAGTAL